MAPRVSRASIANSTGLAAGSEPCGCMEETMVAVKADNRIKLSDGRSLEYAEYGDPEGRPLLHFHGLPSSRLDVNYPAVDEIATRLHARVIAVERPGIGLSDHKPYTVAGWPDIV